MTENVTVLPEQFKLSAPMSPHAAARIDNVSIRVSDFNVPKVDGNLIIEGAGGLMVPINDLGDVYADLFKLWNTPVIVVSKHYLGSINHTLLTVEVLKSRGIEIEGLVFVGAENVDTESIILKKTGLKMITRIPFVEEVNKDFVQEQAAKTDLSYYFI